ncbi:glucose 1-dehydrogenase [Bacillus sp. FJAT-49711]|uniref:SDR family NAD(P)-dependent oxidoreductase n=1 Tax=Bacillus sp. FJAT-49711 TaxID=2833585 RepID=UPI001BC92F99|nr:glucose 1-dehydrogenase [Bacillus sp. FJAT-49711]MBS4219087.1 glucose 1-dehydrogenase [Bacillus sp. FJAT-49711]
MDHQKVKVTIVTGAGRGIGKGIAECFVKEGSIVIIATREYEEGKIVENELKNMGGTAVFIQTDVSSEESIKNMVNETINQFGKIDTLVNNAGITRFIPIEHATLDDWNELINIDLRGPFLCSKYVLPHMKKNNYGSIVNISSNHAIATLPDSEIYAAAKGGVNAMTKSMALSLGEYGIRVNSICPGFTETPHYYQWLSDKGDKDLHEEVLQIHATKRICNPIDIGKLAVYLSSEDAFMITGENIVVDGGVSSRLYNSNKF